MRAALVEYFREKAAIMIATEAAAEGINLQFCSMVVNYDLPWNPQRIEQRIGRCHRYGQRYDVVVVNFLNKNNAADQRVYELLAEKFKLFSGVFGASDEVLGAIESASSSRSASSRSTRTAVRQKKSKPSSSACARRWIDITVTMTVWPSPRNDGGSSPSGSFSEQVWSSPSSNRDFFDGRFSWASLGHNLFLSRPFF